MDDLIDRLESQANDLDVYGLDRKGLKRIIAFEREATARIRQLEAENARLRKASASDDCPFCGSEDWGWINGRDKVHPYRVTCKSCGCGTAHHGDAQAALASWIRRAALQETDSGQ